MTKPPWAGQMTGLAFSRYLRGKCPGDSLTGYIGNILFSGAILVLVRYFALVACLMLLLPVVLGSTSPLSQVPARYLLELDGR